MRISMNIRKLAVKIVIFWILAISTLALCKQATAQTSPGDPSAFAGCGWACIVDDGGYPGCLEGGSSDTHQGCYVWDAPDRPMCAERSLDPHCIGGLDG